MKRLRDRTEPLSPLEANAIALLCSTERYQPELGAKQRVRARLLASGTAARTRIFRPAVVVAFLCVAAGASATIGGTWLVRQRLRENQAGRAELGETERSANNKATASGLHLSTRAEAAQVAPSAQPETSLLGDGSTSMPIHAASDESDHSGSVAATAVGSATKAPSRPSEQVKLVFDSMRALRRDGQPERAARLLDEYMRRYPNGALAEEALALSIEAAIQRGDPRAKELANRYLARYPSGQFQKAAERARARFSP